MKKCIGCGIDKPLSSFYKHTEHKDDHSSKCKFCVKQYSKAYLNSKEGNIRFVTCSKNNYNKRNNISK